MDLSHARNWLKPTAAPRQTSCLGSPAWYPHFMEPDQATQKTADVRDAFLVVREGTSWRDVFRLSPIQVLTIARATPTGFVRPDELCSRNHCELYRNGSTWVVRDLASRNGTQVNGGPVVGERELESGDLIQIGPYELGFTFDLAQPFGAEPTADINASDTALAFDVVDKEQSGGPEIIHRRRVSRYRSPQADSGLFRDRTHKELASLYRLALDMGAAPRAKELAEVVLAGLRSGTHFDIGAVLLLPNAVQADAKASQLTVAAYTAK